MTTLKAVIPVEVRYDLKKEGRWITIGERTFHQNNANLLEATIIYALSPFVPGNIPRALDALNTIDISYRFSESPKTFDFPFLREGIYYTTPVLRKKIECPGDALGFRTIDNGLEYTETFSDDKKTVGHVKVFDKLTRPIDFWLPSHNGWNISSSLHFKGNTYTRSDILEPETMLNRNIIMVKVPKPDNVSSFTPLIPAVVPKVDMEYDNQGSSKVTITYIFPAESFEIPSKKYGGEAEAVIKISIEAKK